MRLTVDALGLRLLAERAARVPGAKPYAPIYGCTLLHAVGQTLTGYATDGDTWLRDSTPANVGEGGRVAVSAKLLASLAAVLPKGVLQLGPHGDGLEITRPGTRDRWTLPGLRAEDFPTWPTEPTGTVVSVPAAELARALDLVGGITKTADPGTRGLRQMELTADGAGLTVRGTDRFRMAAVVVQPETAVTGSACMVVAPELAAVLAPLAREHGRVSVMFPEHDAAGGLVAISAGPVRVMTKLLDRNDSETLRAFIRRALATVRPAYFLADRAELLGQLERASWGSDTLVMDLDDQGELTITAQSAEDARDGTQTMAVDVPADSALSGAGFVGGVNARYLIEACKVYSGETVRIGVDKPAKVGQYAVTDPEDRSPVRYGLAAHLVPESARKAA